MLTKNIIIGSVTLTSAILLSTGCTTSNTIKGASNSGIPRAEILPMTEIQPVRQEFVMLEEPTVVIAESATIYEIQKGDNLGKIARKFNVGVEDICEINGIKDKNKIYIGQNLKIPSFGAVASTQSGTTQSTAANSYDYVVKPGDCLSKIASAYGIKTADLAAANKITNHNSIYVGQKLVVPGGATKTRPTTSTTPSRTPQKLIVLEQAPEMNFDEEPMIIKTTNIGSPAQAMQAPVIQEEAISTPVLEPNKHVASETEDLHAVAQMWGCSVEEIAKFNNIPVNTILKKDDIVLIPNASE